MELQNKTSINYRLSSPLKSVHLKPQAENSFYTQRKELKDTFESKVKFSGHGKAPLPEGVIARMPDGTDVSVDEHVEYTHDGQPRTRKGHLVFADPQNKGGIGYVEYEAEITPTCVDLQYIWNNSTKKDGLALLTWHLTKDIDRAEFIGTQIDNKDIYAIGKKHGMSTPGEAELKDPSKLKASKANKVRGPFNFIKMSAKQKLLEKDWTLE